MKPWYADCEQNVKNILCLNRLMDAIKRHYDSRLRAGCYQTTAAAHAAYYARNWDCMRAILNASKRYPDISASGLCHQWLPLYAKYARNIRHMGYSEVANDDRYIP